MNHNSKPYCHDVILVTGEKNTGKTLFCLGLIKRLKQLNAVVKGIVSPGQYHKKCKTGIIARDIYSGEERLLATYSPGWDSDKPEREWLFQPEAFEWGNQKLKNSIPTEYLIIDELGFMEFEKNGGWKNAFTILETGVYQLSFIVIRPLYIPIAEKNWSVIGVIKIDASLSIEELVCKTFKDYRLDIR